MKIILSTPKRIYINKVIRTSITGLAFSIIILFPLLVSSQCSTGATINITEPDPWEVIDAGTNFNITWNGSLQGSSCPVGISYRVNNGPWTTITSSTSDDGLYTWSVPSNINSTDIDLGVVYTTTDAGGGAVGDIVSNFDIIPPCSEGATINITEPDPWEVIDAGTNFNITWNGSLQGSSCPVAISYRINNGTWINITSSTSDDGSYNWSVPSNINSTDVDLGVVYTTLDANGGAVGDIVYDFDIIPPSAPELEFNQCISVPNSTVVMGTFLGNSTFQLENIGGSNWTGNIFVTLTDPNNVSNNQTLATFNNQTINSGSTFSGSTGLNLITVPVGDYRILVGYSNAPSGGSDFVSAGSCSPFDTAGGTGTVYHYEDVEVTTAIPPELEFSQCISVPNSTVVMGTFLGNSTFQLENIGGSNWTGNIFVTLTDPNNVSNNQTLATFNNQTINSGSTFSGSTGLNLITVPVGDYRILVGYSNAPSGGSDFVSAGSCSPFDTAGGTGTVYHYEDVEVTTAIPPELEFSQCISVPNSTVVMGTFLGNSTFQLENIGGSSWTGNIFVTLTDPNNVSNNQTLATFNNQTINSGSTFSGSTGLNLITVPVGDYRILVGYSNAPSGGSDFVSAGSCSPFDTAGGTGTVYHYEDVEVVNSLPPELEFETCISLSSSSIESGTNLGNNTFDLENIGNSSWTGNIIVSLANPNNSSSNQTLSSFNNITLAPNASFIGSTGIDLITLPAGNYWFLVAYTNAPNGGLDFASDGLCTPTATINGTVFHYENLTITSAGCSSFNDLPSTPPDTEAFEAAQCLCNLGYITPQNGNVNPNAPIIRQDLAKVVYYALYRGDAASPASEFPVPFTDLDDSTQPYYKYAKAMSYLEYDDGISPFNREFTNFYPTHNIEMRYALKVILEAFDIPINYGNGGTIQNVQYGQDAYEYVYTAWSMGLITSSSADATQNAIRKNIFIVLDRLLTQGSCTDCQQDCWPLPDNSSDYFIPGNFKLNSLARNVNISEGYFDQYQKTSFSIPGKNMTMDFTHTYNSYLLEIPSNLRNVCPLGEGWTHSYNSYIIEQDGSGSIPDMLYVIWSNGSINMFNRNTLSSESLGDFDVMTESGSSINIKKKNQIEYTFEKHNGIWYLDYIEDRNGNYIDPVLQSGHNGFWRVDRVVDAHARELEFYYQSGTNFLSRVREETGNRNIYFTINSSNDLVNYTNPKGNSTFYDYGSGNLNHYLEKVTLPEGNVMDINYDVNKKLSGIQFPGIGQPFNVNVIPNHGTTAQYESSITNPQNGITTNNKFDSEGRLEFKEVGNTSTEVEYNAEKLPTKITFEGQVTEINYDSNGNVTLVDQPLGIKHTYTYNSINDITSYKDSKNNISTYSYDNNDNLDIVNDNLGFITNYNYNSSGLLTSVTNPESITTNFYYDTYGNQTSINQPLGISTTFDFDNISRLIQTVNAENQITNYNYDVHNLIIETERISNSGNINTDYNYDLNDNLTTVVNDANNSTTMTYNDRDLMETITFGNDTKTFDYRDDNLLEKHTRADGSMLNYTYDSQGRITNDGYSGYTYDSRNNIKSIIHNGTTSFNYDVLDRITDYNDIYGKAIDYTYDVNSNVTQVEYPGNYDVNYVYDDNNRLTQVKFNNNSKTISYTYFDDGRLKKITYPNGTFTDYTYDNAGRLRTLKNRKSSNSIISSYTYTMDKLGNHTNVVKIEPFSGPPPLTTLTYNGSYNSENEIISYGGSAFEHNANGELNMKNGRSLSFDIGGMITSNGNRDYEYDGMKFMMEADRNGNTKRYTWDIRGIGNVIVESNASGSPLYYYIHGLGLCARVNASNTNDIRYYHGDYRGSVIAMTDANENITHKYQYLPYGEISQFEEADTDNPFKYVGKWGVMHEGGNHYYMRARQYDAETGRFLSEDPVWHENLYTYTTNPIINIDLQGTEEVEPEDVELCLINNYNGGGFIGGHSYLLYNTKQGELNTLGLFPKSHSMSKTYPENRIEEDLYSNFEYNDVINSNFTESKCLMVDKDLFESTIKTSDKQYKIFGNVCTDWAVDVWNKTTETNIIIKGIDNPKNLSKIIENE